jgi:hypothetical protein
VYVYGKSSRQRLFALSLEARMLLLGALLIGILLLVFAVLSKSH